MILDIKYRPTHIGLVHDTFVCNLLQKGGYGLRTGLSIYYNDIIDIYNIMVCMYVCCVLCVGCV